ncbi:MAG: PIN-like domain-containing protein [Candidatus Hodarchaeales archaeon]
MSTNDDNDSKSLSSGDTFPEAQDLFRYSIKPIENILDHCIVVLDANVLLFPYTTSKESLEVIRNIYNILISENRLLLPGEAVREFFRHRGNKVKELYQQIYQKTNKVQFPQNISYPMLENLEEYSGMKVLEDKLRTLLKEYQASISLVLEIISSWSWHDPVTTMYSELFNESIIVDPNFDSSEISKEAKRRDQLKIPPGYKDYPKTGDLRIWKSILEIGSTHNRDLIFVTDERKHDWWLKTESQLLFCRPELVDEYHRASKGNTFHTSSFSEFLKLFNVTGDVLAEIRDVEKRISQFDLYSTQGTIGTSICRSGMREWLIIQLSKLHGPIIDTDQKSHILHFSDGYKAAFHALIPGEHQGMKFMNTYPFNSEIIFDFDPNVRSIRDYYVVISSMSLDEAIRMKDILERYIKEGDAICIHGYCHGETFKPIGRSWKDALL